MKKTPLRKVSKHLDPNNPRGWKHKPSPEYQAWGRMIDRCYNQNDKSYRYYGAKGITVDPIWKTSFDVFFHDIGKRPSSRHTLERIDNGYGYFPSNCRWATWKEQSRNKKNNRIIVAFGESKTLADWVDDPRCSVGNGALRHRFNKNIFGSPERNLVEPSLRPRSR